MRQHFRILKIALLFYTIQNKSTSFPGLQCEDEGRDEEALVGPVTCLPKKWQYLTATRQGVAR
jgi:hypothetical protein